MPSARAIRVAIAVVLAMMLAACGSGGSGSAMPGAGEPTPTPPGLPPAEPPIGPPAVPPQDLPPVTPPLEPPPQPPPPGVVSLQIRTLSSRPDVVSAGDTLLQVTMPAGTDPSRVAVRLNGVDVTDRFHLQPDAVNLIGLVDRSEPRYTLVPGENRVEAFYAGVSAGALRLTNHPSSGPVFSGPQQSPFVCETASFELPDGTTPGSPLDPATCSTATRVDFVYWSSSQQRYRPLVDPGQVPADAESIVVDGNAVRHVARVETGTINRAIYQIAMLHDPARDPAPSVHARTHGWNRKLVFAFGGGCDDGWYRQGKTAGWWSWYFENGELQRKVSVLDHELLRRGYAVASSTLNVFGNNCSELTSAETMAMVRERFIEGYGVPRYTIGWGCSGGAYQEHQIADNYPGLLDGLIAGCSYPEVNFTTVHFMTDARLLHRYFQNFYFTPLFDYTETEKQAISGLQAIGTLKRMDDGPADRIRPTGCPSVLPFAERYDPVTNPDGARCDIFDHLVNVWGTKPNPMRPEARPIAQRPLDNEGVQYGLAALNSGRISVAQFLDLNEKIGGFDSDGNPTAAQRTLPARRSIADPQTLPVAYRSGRLLFGGWGLKDVPIIDYRLYEDRNAAGTFHLRHHSFITRERLRKANGDAANQVMLVEGAQQWTFTSESALVMHALEQMDRWLANIESDSSAGSRHEKVVRNRPQTLREGCVPPGRQFPEFTAETLLPASGACAVSYPVGIGTRAAAGAPPVADVVKCQRKTVAAAIADNDYSVSFTAAERSRLESIFASGVCDWTRPGIGQPSPDEYRSLQPWQFFR